MKIIVKKKGLYCLRRS